MSEDAYMQLLDKALAALPPPAQRQERFEVPRPETAVSGNRTVLYNLKEISDRLNRNRDHIVKFFSAELATAGSIDGLHAVFQGKFDNRSLSALLDRYVADNVLCPICGQPDTNIAKRGRYRILVCEACGATSSLRGF
jgi:translation initiation factor 2 subunit 2